jgi:hypothetical protein
MLRSILFTIVLAGLMVALGCGGNPTAPSGNKDIEAFFNGVSPVLTGVVGDYTFTGNDGSMESGKLIANADGKITLTPDRGSSVYSNSWFTIDVEYVNPRYYSGSGLPVYYLGDTFTYKVNLDYKQGLPLNLFPIIYSKVTAEQRYWPTLTPLPGAYQEIWDPCLIPAYGDIQLVDTFTIVSGTVPGNDATVCKVDVKVLGGIFQFNVANGVCGLWDP